MRSSLLVFALALVVIAVPLASDAHAQTTGSLSDIVSKAETGANPNGGKNTDIKLTFRSGITLPSAQADQNKVFTVGGKAVTVHGYTSSNSGDTEIILRLAVADAFAPDARPEVAIARDQSFTSGPALNIVTYNTGSVTADDKIQPDVLSCQANAVDPCGAKVTGKQTVTIVYDEPTTARIQDYVNLRISKHGFDSAPYPSRNLVSIDGSGTDTHILTFAGKPSNTGSRGSLEILPEVRDLAGNNIDDFSMFRFGALTDGQDPIILKAYVYDGTHIWLHASENLYLPNTTGRSSLEHLDANSFTNIRLSDVVRGSCGTGTEEPDSLQMGGARVVWGSGSFDFDTGERIHKIQIMESSLNDICMNVQSSGIMTIGEVRDVALNKIQRTPNFAVTDGQPPTISSSKITGPTELTIKADEPLLAPEGTFADLMINHDRSTQCAAGVSCIEPAITEIAGTGTDTLTVTFAETRNRTVDTEAVGKFTIKNTLTDLSGNPEIGLFNGTTRATISPSILDEKDAVLADGQPPRLSGRAEVKETNLVILRFTEDINTNSTAGPERFSMGDKKADGTTAGAGSVQVHGKSARSSVLSVFPISPPTNCATTTSGICITSNNVYVRFGDTSPLATSPTDGPLADEDDGVSLTIVNMADAAGNRVQNVPAVADPKQVPGINGAKIINATTIQIEFDEPVVPKAGTSAANWAASFYNLRLSSQEGVSRDITAAGLTTTISDPNHPDRARIIDVMFRATDDPIPTDETATIGVRNLKDTSNPGPVRDFVDREELDVADGQPPTVTSAKITGPNQIAMEFSESVVAKKSNFTKLMIGTGQNAERTIKDFVIGSGSKTITFTFSGDGAADDAMGSIVVLNDGVRDAQWNFLAKDTDSCKTDYSTGGLAGITCTISDGQKPMLESLAITGPNEITAEFTEPVKQGTRDGGVADGFVGFKIGENDRRNTTITTPSNSSTAAKTLKLTFGGSAAGLTDSGTITITGDLEDASKNKFDRLANQEVKAGQVPYIKSAKFAGPNQITIEFSEGVSLPRGAGHFANLQVAGESSARTVLSASLMDSGRKASLKFDGDAVSTGATGRMAVSGATDSVSNVMAAAPNTKIDDGQRPTAMSEVTGPNQVTVTFSEPVTATASDFGRERFDGKMTLNLGTKTVADERIISNWTQVSPTVYTMRFDGGTAMTDAAARDDTGYILISGDVMDASKNKFNPTDTANGEKITDGQNPILYRAEIGEGRYVQIVYSEPATAPRGSYFNLNFAGDVKELIDRPHSGDRHHLNYTDEPATASTATLSVGTEITDPAGNKVETTGTIRVHADEKPVASSARVTHDNEVTVTFSEPVRNVGKGMFAVTLEGAAASKQPRSTSGEYTNMIKLMFADDTFAAGTSGTLKINTSSASITDLLEKDLASPFSLPISPLQEGTTRSALVSGPNTITITFNERVIASTANFENLDLIISGERQGRSIDSVSGTGTDTIMITFGGDAVPSDATAEIDIMRVTNTDRETYEPLMDVRVGDGQAPTLDAVMISSSNEDAARAILGDTVTVQLTASEPIRIPVMTINEEAAAPVQGTGNMWNATRTVTAADLERESKTVQFTIDYMDTARNAGDQVTSTTDDSGVTMGIAPATISGKVCVTTSDDGTCDTGDQGYVSDPPYVMYLVPPVNSEMMWNDKPYRTAQVNQDTGMYVFENVTPNMEWVVQTKFFPRDLTVKDDATSWYTRVTPTEGQEVTFDVAFYRVPQSERNTLDLRTYNDINRNGIRDAGEDGIPNLTFRAYTYLSASYEDVVTGENGSVVKNDMMRGDWAVLHPEDWQVSSFNYQRTDPTSNKQYDEGRPIVDDPLPNSIHTMTFGMYLMP